MKETDIRPQAIFDEYLGLCAQDTQTYFGSAARTAVACPACDRAGTPTFDKNGFTYQVCEFCETLFVSPRPPASAFEEYYRTAPSSRFWASTFYKETADARRKLLWEPKARLVRDRLAALNCSAHAVVDIGGGYGLFAEEMRKISPCDIRVIEPGPHLAQVCRDKGIVVIEKFLEHVEPAELPPLRKAFVSFELFEHLHDPGGFLRRLLGLMSDGDLFMFTTLSGTGLDIRLLWEESKSVSPPHHLNFLNPRSIAHLLRRLGFEVVEVSTPGQLDLDIVLNGRKFVKDRFWRLFIERSTERDRQEWQKVVAESGWSSHMLVICRKPEEPRGPVV